jgi:hypothetical protein
LTPLLLLLIILSTTGCTSCITEFPVPTASSYPGSITAGPDGNLWFTEYWGNRIGRITPAGVITEFSTGLFAHAQPPDITAGPDGNLWFTEYHGNKIGYLELSRLCWVSVPAPLRCMRIGKRGSAGGLPERLIISPQSPPPGRKRAEANDPHLPVRSRPDLSPTPPLLKGAPLPFQSRSVQNIDNSREFS